MNSHQQDAGAGVGFGLIGTGFMGRAHAIALNEVAAVFPEVSVPRCVCVVDRDANRAAEAETELRFNRHSTDWRTLLDDPEIDALSICTPNHLHFEMAMGAVEAGKHVLCEKPLTLSVTEAEQLAGAAKQAGVVHLVGFNYITNPLLQLAREIIRSGEIGEPISFSGRYFEDYMASPEVPYSWRCERRLAGSGALADLGSHLINMLNFLLGQPVRVRGHVRTVIEERKELRSGNFLPVENEDIAMAQFELQSGIPANIEISRVATGYKCGLQCEIFGTAGSIRFDQERMNELQLYRSDDDSGRRGFRTILVGPEHPDLARFCPAPGHGLGINDLKVIEMRNFLRAIQGGQSAYPDFEEGLRVQRVMEAIEASSTEDGWIGI